MKKNVEILFLLFLCTLFFHPNLWAQSKLDKIPNLSISLSNGKKDSLYSSNVNLGLISNIQESRGLITSILSSVVRTDMNGIQIGGLDNISGKNANGLQIAGLLNATGRNSNGFMIGGLTNLVNNQSNGVMVSGLSNLTGVYQNGIALACLTNIAVHRMNGLQLSAIMNMVGDNARGLQISAVSNVASKVKGAQFSFFSNIASTELNGFQFSPVMNIASQTHLAFQWSVMGNVSLKNMHGCQLGLGNYAGSLTGSQIGLINLCDGKTKGVQIGIINFSRDSTATKIGLVNVSPHTRIQYMQYAGNTSKINSAIRFRNDYMYYILGFGTHYLGLNDKFSGCIFYRIGVYQKLSSRWLISMDGGYNHIENFDNEDANTPERMYSLQLRGNVEYQFTRKFSGFVSCGYGWTRYYDKNRFYQKKTLLELGIVLF